MEEWVAPALLSKVFISMHVRVREGFLAVNLQDPLQSLTSGGTAIRFSSILEKIAKFFRLLSDSKLIEKPNKNLKGISSQ